MKENQRVALTKRLLKEALIRLLQEKDIQKISVKELCQASGINRTTFYHHYGRPADVLQEMEEELIAGIPVVMPEKGSSVQSIRRLLLKQTTLVLQYMYDRMELMKLMFCNSSTESEFARKLFAFPAVRQAIEASISDKYDGESRALASCFLVNGCYGMFREWILDDAPKSPEELALLLADLLQKSEWIQE